MGRHQKDVYLNRCGYPSGPYESGREKLSFCRALFLMPRARQPSALALPVISRRRKRGDLGPDLSRPGPGPAALQLLVDLAACHLRRWDAT